MSSSTCWFLTCIQISQEAGKVVWYSHLFQNFPQFVVIHTVKGFSIVHEAQVDVFLKFAYFFCAPMNVDNLISGSSAFSKSSLYIWKFSFHILLKPSLKDFEHNLASMWNEHSCTFSVHEVLLARILEWVAIFFSSEPHFFRTLHCGPSILGGQTTAWFIASLTYASPFTTTKLWSMKGSC